MEFEKIQTVEDLFKELDEHKFTDVAKPLAAYRNELMKEGFTRRESMRLVEAYSKFLHDLCVEDYMSEKRRQEVADELMLEEEAEGELHNRVDDEWDSEDD